MGCGAASIWRRLGYRAYRNPVLMLLVGPSLVFLFERRFPQRGMSRRILASVVMTNLALVAWALLRPSMALKPTRAMPSRGGIASVTSTFASSE